jgi:hypothetical protein
MVNCSGINKSFLNCKRRYCTAIVLKTYRTTGSDTDAISTGHIIPSLAILFCVDGNRIWIGKN